MSFGRNPHVAKAEAAEQKALTARDGASYERAWRDAGRLWERAAQRETDAKRRGVYEAKAETARTTADAPYVPDDVAAPELDDQDEPTGSSLN